MGLRAVHRVLIVVAGLSMVPSTAGAAVADLSSLQLEPLGRYSGGSGVTMSVSDPDGVANNVIVSAIGEPGPASVAFVVTDTAGMTPGAGCTSVDSQTVRCSVVAMDPSVRVVLDLGAGDDSELAYLPPQVGLSVDGGAGDDQLPGVADRANAGRAAFSVVGGLGDDTITAFGSGALIDGGAGDDSVDGGNGARLSYRNSPRAVRVDLAAGTGGADGEHDVFTDINEVVGSSFDDDLRGSDARESLEGGEGADDLYGRGGDDRLIGGGGDDRVFGGAGQDTISTSAETGVDERDRVAGGPGDDVIEGGLGRDTLSGDEGSDTIRGVGLGDVVAARDGTLDRILCLRPRPGDTPRRPRILRVDTEDSVIRDCTGTRRSGPASGVLSDIDEATNGGARLAVGLACSVDALRRCPMRLKATAAELGVIARRNIEIPRAGYRRVSLTLSPAARTALRCTGQLAVRVTLVTRDTAGRKRTRTRLVITRAGTTSTSSCASPAPSRDG